MNIIKKGIIGVDLGATMTSAGIVHGNKITKYIEKRTPAGEPKENVLNHLYSIIEKGQEAINGILELAQESEMPRAYEVAGQLIKSVSDATDKLMDLQKKVKDVNEEKESKSPTTVNNALFVGSTAELQKLLKNNIPSK